MPPMCLEILTNTIEVNTSTVSEECWLVLCVKQRGMIIQTESFVKKHKFFSSAF